MAYQALQNEANVRSERLFDIDSMPSVRSLSGFALSALGAAQNVLGYGMTSPVVRQDSFAASASCSTNGQLSCQNSSAVADLWCVAIVHSYHNATRLTLNPAALTLLVELFFRHNSGTLTLPRVPLIPGLFTVSGPTTAMERTRQTVTIRERTQTSQLSSRLLARLTS